VAAFLVGPLGGSAALAQGKDGLGRARERFREGLALEAGGNYARALQVFKEVAEIKSTPAVRFHIAQCEEKTGDYIQALGSYRLALLEAQSKKVKDVVKEATAAIAALEPKIPALTIRRGEGATVATVTLDERALGATEIGTSMPVNPGPHVIEASASGKQPFKSELNLADGEKETIEVILRPEESAPRSTTSEESTTPPPSTSSSPLRTAGFVVGALGIVGVGVGATFVGLRQSTLSELETKCGADHKTCPPDAQTLIDRGELESTVATATLIGGGATLALGIVLVLVAPNSAPSAASSIGIAPFVAGSPTGATLRLQF
jgi:hypothetical protein